MRLNSTLVGKLYQWAFAKAGSRPPDFVIGPEVETPYLQRWWIIPRNLIFNIYLHRFLHSDEDRALHDHPWVNCSIIIDGEYIEHSMDGVATPHKAGDVKFRRAVAAHRLELVGFECWTIFITGPVIREWGFHCPKGWRHWKEFVSDRDHGKVGRGCE